MPDSRRPPSPAPKRADGSQPHLTAMRDRLGLPVAASGQDVVNAAAAVLKGGTLSVREMAALRSRVGLDAGATDQEVIDAAASRLRGLQAQAAAVGPVRGANPRDVIDWATTTGRISASSRSTWERNWMADPVRTDAILRILAPVPSAGSAVAAASARIAASEATVTQTQSGVSALPARIQKAAARQSDPALVERWSQRYAGMADAEVSPDCLLLDGEEWLANEVRRDENDAEHGAKLASLERFHASAEAHRLQNVADADYLREHGGRPWGVSASEILARRQPPTPG